MAIKTVSGIHDEVIAVTTSGNTWRLLESAKIVSADFGFSTAVGANNNTFDIAGDIQAGQIGIYGLAPRMTVTVRDTGFIYGTNGISMAGAGRLGANIDGEIDAIQYGVFSDAARTEIHLGKEGTISGVAGIFSNAATTFSAQIEGDITGITYGIVSAAGEATIEIGRDATITGQNAVYGAGTKSAIFNQGEISGLHGIIAGGDGSLIVNGVHGHVSGLQYALLAASVTGDDLRIVNHGTVVSSAIGAAVYGGDGNEQVLNDGRLIGNVSLGKGNDEFDTRGGFVKGLIYGGLGDDTLITDRAGYKLIESGGEGTADTVRSTVTYKLSDNVERLFLLGGGDIDGTGTAFADKLHGNSGDNTIKGLDGIDYLFGHKGNDRLFGGGAADWFYFSTGDGDDRILDYVDGTDQIHLEDWAAITSLTDLKNNHATNVGADLLIEAGNDSLFIKGVHKEDLGAMDVFI